MTEDKEAPYPDLQGKSVSQLAAAQYKLKLQIEETKAKQAKLQNKYDYLRKELLPDTMEDLDLENLAVRNVGRVNLRPELYVSIVKGMKKEAHLWLQVHGHESLVKPEVNSSTLKAFVREQIKAGVELPDTIFNITPYMMAAITKS